jgi:hypothetical protein
LAIAGFFLVVAHVFFSSTGSEVGEGFGFWLDRVETLRSPEQGWYFGALGSNSVGHSRTVGRRLQPSRI